MSDVQPIRPDDVSLAKAKTIPGPVIAAFNELIAKHWNGREAVVKQEDVLALAIQRLTEVGTLTGDGPHARRIVFDNHWLDVEEAFRAVGWKVEYDKPAYCETYPATFTFSRK